MMNRTDLVNENNMLGLQEYDLVSTTGKGICIVLRRPTIDELVVYSMSSITETHEKDDEGAARVARYTEDGTVVSGKDEFTITGIASYDNPILALKDFINQADDIDFDEVDVEDEDETDEDDETMDTDCETSDCETAATTETDIQSQMLALLIQINEKLNN